MRRGVCHEKRGDPADRLFRGRSGRVHRPLGGRSLQGRQRSEGLLFRPHQLHRADARGDGSRRPSRRPFRARTGRSQHARRPGRHRPDVGRPALRDPVRHGDDRPPRRRDRDPDRDHPGPQPERPRRALGPDPRTRPHLRHVQGIRPPGDVPGPDGQRGRQAETQLRGPGLRGRRRNDRDPGAVRPGPGALRPRSQAPRRPVGEEGRAPDRPEGPPVRAGRGHRRHGLRAVEPATSTLISKTSTKA